LTRKEYDLLKLFFTYPNQAFSRERILEKVWDMNYTTFSNVVDVHITYLRKKLGMDKEHMTIESVRGVGYRMNTK
jgi:DNA-binding response OmpR family regulator